MADIVNVEGSFLSLKQGTNAPRSIQFSVRRTEKMKNEIGFDKGDGHQSILVLAKEWEIRQPVTA